MATFGLSPSLSTWSTDFGRNPRTGGLPWSTSQSRYQTSACPGLLVSRRPSSQASIRSGLTPSFVKSSGLSITLLMALPSLELKSDIQFDYRTGFRSVLLRVAPPFAQAPDSRDSLRRAG